MDVVEAIAIKVKRGAQLRERGGKAEGEGTRIIEGHTGTTARREDGNRDHAATLPLKAIEYTTHTHTYTRRQDTCTVQS